ncbi:hypothetical protein KF840_13755 [bacterium]|nr:hypothetical protein [bacterium]
MVVALAAPFATGAHALKVSVRGLRRPDLVGGPRAIDSFPARLIVLAGRAPTGLHTADERTDAAGQRIAAWRIDW